MVFVFVLLRAQVPRLVASRRPWRRAGPGVTGSQVSA